MFAETDWPEKSLKTKKICGFYQIFRSDSKIIFAVSQIFKKKISKEEQNQALKTTNEDDLKRKSRYSIGILSVIRYLVTLYHLMIRI